MVQELNNMGICATCNNHNGCLSFQNGLQARRPVQFCDEFDNRVSGRAAHRDENRWKNADPLRGQVNEMSAQRAIGLCINCDHRSGCMFSLSPGGVWHCEEYA